MPVTTPTHRLRELDHRNSGGIDVTLLWEQEKERLLVFVNDTRSGECFVVRAHHEEAMTAFHHPYAYSARADVHVSPMGRSENSRPLFELQEP